jgi:hypothetical protein
MLPLSSAGTAAASPSNPAAVYDCTYILETSNYRLTSERVRYCNIGEGGGVAWLTCYAGLQNTGVRQYVATLACNAAAD